MPTYEYLCHACGEQFDVFQSFKDKPLKTHAGCGGDVQKVFHASGVVFKGSGFYVTDSRRKKAKSGSSESGSSESGSSDSGSSDSGSSDSGASKSASKSNSEPAKKAATSATKSSSSSDSSSD